MVFVSNQPWTISEIVKWPRKEAIGIDYWFIPYLACHSFALA